MKVRATRDILAYEVYSMTGREDVIISKGTLAERTVNWNDGWWGVQFKQGTLKEDKHAIWLAVPADAFEELV